MKAKDCRKGSYIIYNSQPHKVLDSYYHAPGKGMPVVQLKLRNLVTGLSTEVRFNSMADVEEADIFFTEAEYLYEEKDECYFFIHQTSEILTIPSKNLEHEKKFLLPNTKVQLIKFNDNPLGIQLPAKVELTVIETPPEIKGASVTNVGKPAVLETGLQTTVPPFITQGEKIVVSTEDGSYIGRAEKK
ncbi:MAG: elongation factor P [Deltaproteobacteria bacterium]|nr:elongation factor P [Deltaproteobacteria bacterium]MCX7952250.1 elongation factor P [Deltaproteobacteria bacterium]